MSHAERVWWASATAAIPAWAMGRKCFPKVACVESPGGSHVRDGPGFA